MDKFGDFLIKNNQNLSKMDFPEILYPSPSITEVSIPFS